MELYAKGQLSFLILTCMKERDFYGLDIISEISERSNGRINLKKPSVYSNLTRMEKQGYISAYLKSSDLGPNRKYYSLTEKGREFYQELKDYFDRNNIDVFQAFIDGDASPVATTDNFLETPVQPTEVQVPEVTNETTEDKTDDDFFDFSFADEKPQMNYETEQPDRECEKSYSSEQEMVAETREPELTTPPVVEEVAQIQQVVPPSQSAYAFSIKSALTQEKQQTSLDETKSDDGVFLSQEKADEYNKKIYDISKDINKYRKKRSFAEDQMEIVATNPLTQSQDRKQTNLEEFKNALLSNREKYQDQRISQVEFTRKMNGYRDVKQPVVEPVEEIKNDAVFITNRVSEKDIEKAKKIEPPRLQIISENTRESKLPAPKRDVTIDPSHKERLTQLYARTRDQSSSEFREDAIYDYNDLKDYYTSQNLSFNAYQKPARKIKHNTNKLYMAVSMITFLFALVLSIATYFIVKSADLLSGSMEFLYYVLPALFLPDVAFRIYKFKQSRGWLPKQMLPIWAIWALLLLYCGAVVAVNYLLATLIGGFTIQATTLILPLIMGVVALPLRYYIKRIAIIKYWH